MEILTQIAASYPHPAETGASSSAADVDRPTHSSRNIVENATNWKALSTLAAAVKAAELVDTLASPGPFTVFAPSDAAFAKLPAGAVDTLLRPENKNQLTSMVTYHVLAGRWTVAELRERVQANDGDLTLRTVEGDSITIQKRGERLHIVDSRGDQAEVMIADVLQSNGVIHMTDTVLLPLAR